MHVDVTLQIGDRSETIEAPDDSRGDKADQPSEGSDRCVVWALDLNRAREGTLQQRSLTGLSHEEMAALVAAEGKLFDEFYPVVAEEELTNRYYSLPNGEGVITASVFYTDERMAAKIGGKAQAIESVIMCVLVSEKEYPNACETPGNALAEHPYTKFSIKARVKTRKRLGDRTYIAVLECEFPRAAEALAKGPDAMH